MLNKFSASMAKSLSLKPSVLVQICLRSILRGHKITQSLYTFFITLPPRWKMSKLSFWQLWPPQSVMYCGKYPGGNWDTEGSQTNVAWTCRRPDHRQVITHVLTKYPWSCRNAYIMHKSQLASYLCRDKENFRWLLSKNGDVGRQRLHCFVLGFSPHYMFFFKACAW